MGQINPTIPVAHAIGDAGATDDANLRSAALTALVNESNSQDNRITALEPVAVVNAKAKAYGAVGDGTTDDYAAIISAINAISGAQGGVVFLPRGTYGVSQTIEVPTNVRLVGEGTRASRLLALAGFTGTRVVKLGPTGSRSFNVGLSDLMVDANHIVATGVYADGINEMSGLRQVIAQNFTSIGVDVESYVSGSNGLAQNFDLSELELYYSATAAVTPIGLRLVSTSATRDFARVIRGITVNSSDGTTTLAGAVGVVVDGYQSTTIEGVHAERVSTAVQVGPNNYSHGTTLLGVWGSSTVTDLVRIETNAGDSITVIGLSPMGATNTLVDVPRGVTLASATESRLGLYAVGTANSVVTSSGTITSHLAALRVTGNVGFFNTAPAARATVSGSRGGNAALASLLTALATYGLITDGTTA